MRSRVRRRLIESNTGYVARHIRPKTNAHLRRRSVSSITGRWGRERTPYAARAGIVCAVPVGTAASMSSVTKRPTAQWPSALRPSLQLMDCSSTSSKDLPLLKNRHLFAELRQSPPSDGIVLRSGQKKGEGREEGERRFLTILDQ